MAMGPRLDLRQSQSLVMTPQLRQAIKLLQFSNMEVNAFVEEELERNPLLERDERSDAPADERAALDQVLPAETIPGDAADFAGSDVLPDSAASPLDADHGETYEPGSPSDGEAYAHAGSGKGGASVGYFALEVRPVGGHVHHVPLVQLTQHIVGPLHRLLLTHRSLSSPETARRSLRH